MNGEDGVCWLVQLLLVKYGEDIEELDLRSFVWEGKGDVMLGLLRLLGRGFV